jgi:hypothetical protein
VLQYADDTIILVRADADSVHRLKHALDMFSATTGLVINFNKSTVTLMHLPEGALQGFMEVLQCKLGSFPQTYLGLPLSNIKLPLSAFAPLIARVDKYLASWQALLLSTAGRVVLINSVLAGIPTYAMGAMLLPPALSMPLTHDVEHSFGLERTRSPGQSVSSLGKVSAAPRKMVASVSYDSTSRTPAYSSSCCTGYTTRKDLPGPCGSPGRSLCPTLAGAWQAHTGRP